jgi:RNA polymerase sigma-70 factor, ECF subfamily
LTPEEGGRITPTRDENEIEGRHFRERLRYDPVHRGIAARASMPQRVTTRQVIEPCHLTPRQLAAVSDDELMSHLQCGHDDALGVLFDRYHRLVLTVASKIVRDASEAEDVMQAVFLEIYRAAAQFDRSKGATKAWILQYAYHRAINRRRQLTNRCFYSQVSPEELDRVHPATSASRNMLQAQERSVLIHEALAKLKGRQKEVLELAYFDGLTMKEIAGQIGESVGNVRHHFYRGLNQLRLCLENEYSSAGAIREEAARVGA